MIKSQTYPKRKYGLYDIGMFCAALSLLFCLLFYSGIIHHHYVSLKSFFYYLLLISVGLIAYGMIADLALNPWLKKNVKTYWAISLIFFFAFPAVLYYFITYKKVPPDNLQEKVIRDIESSRQDYLNKDKDRAFVDLLVKIIGINFCSSLVLFVIIVKFPSLPFLNLVLILSIFIYTTSLFILLIKMIFHFINNKNINNSSRPLWIISFYLFHMLAGLVYYFVYYSGYKKQEHNQEKLKRLLLK